LKVLIVDDNPASKRYTGMALEEAGIEYESTDCGLRARALLDSADGASFDVMLLDVDVPGTKGWDFLTDLRAAGQQIPVVFVTVREALEDRVRALNLGADDYILKPFEFPELVARLRAVLRRCRRGERLQVGDLVLDPRNRRAGRRGEAIELTPREFDVLWILALADGKPVSREEIHANVWGADFDPETERLEPHVRRLNEKFGLGGKTVIETIRGEAYRLRP
jgi:two-component system copper resistance phosphate regulon response regulator CusR